MDGQYSTAKVPVARHFLICFKALHTKDNGGTTTLLSSLHETENVSNAARTPKP